MYHCILILFLFDSLTAIQLGRIQQASWILNLTQIDKEFLNISNITCDQCLCQMIAMNNLTASIACQQKWKTCQLLFWNTTAQLQTDEISIVYFQTIPTFLQTTTTQQSLMTPGNSEPEKTDQKKYINLNGNNIIVVWRNYSSFTTEFMKNLAI